MSILENVNLVNMEDSRLHHHEKIDYNVYRASDSTVVMKYPAVSQSTSSVVWSIQTPSINTQLVNRLVIHSKPILKFTLNNTTGAAQNVYAMLGLGSNAAVGSINENLLPNTVAGNPLQPSTAWGPYPFNSLATTISSTINGTTITSQIANYIDIIGTRMYYDADNNMLQSTCPSVGDNFKYYGMSNGFVGNVMSDASNIVDSVLLPRGSFPMKLFSDPACANPVPLTTTLANATSVVYYLLGDFYEPILAQPWAYNMSLTHPTSMYGIQTLNFNITLGPANRILRSSVYNPTTPANTFSITNIELQGWYSNPELQLTFLTPQPNMLFPSKNLTSYTDFVYYPSPVPAGTLAVGGTQTINSNNIQLNTVFDRVAIAVRKVRGLQTPFDSDHYLPITSVNVVYNNRQGLCSTYSPADLFFSSLFNGLNVPYQSFVGQSFLSGFGTAGKDSGNQANIPMCGGPLILNTNDITIDAMYAPGSIISSNLFLQIGIANNDVQAIALGNYELIIVTFNSTLLINEGGASQAVTSFLDKNMVLQTSTQQPVNSGIVGRSVGRGRRGAGFFDSILSGISDIGKSILGAVPVVGPIAKNILGAIPHPLAQAASSGLGALGMGKHGRGVAGGVAGGVSGGDNRLM